MWKDDECPGNYVFEVFTWKVRFSTLILPSLMSLIIFILNAFELDRDLTSCGRLLKEFAIEYLLCILDLSFMNFGRVNFGLSAFDLLRSDPSGKIPSTLLLRCAKDTLSTNAISFRLSRSNLINHSVLGSQGGMPAVALIALFCIFSTVSVKI